MIVLSEETLKGGELINDKRKSFGLKPLDIFSVKLIEEDNISDDVEERKVSSSNYRIKLLGTLIKPPKVNSKNRKFIIYLLLYNNNFLAKSKYTQDSIHYWINRRHI